eukprot:GHVO01014985.1.p1 GENE.GHVO01014985.1~~GHVO01014985.1.p1  ORF type:complete len:185 (+),score=27.06 GHVO01014985.1:321-875(+)
MTQATQDDAAGVRAVVRCVVGAAPTTTELDTGAHISIMGESIYQGLGQIDPTLELQEATKRPLNADRTPMEVVGELQTTVSIGPAAVVTNISVVKGEVAFLLGMEEIRAMNGWVGEGFKIGEEHIPFVGETSEDMAQNVLTEPLAPRSDKEPPKPARPGRQDEGPGAQFRTDGYRSCANRPSIK